MAKYFLIFSCSWLVYLQLKGRETDPPKDSKRTSDQVIQVEVRGWPAWWKAEITFFCFLFLWHNTNQKHTIFRTPHIPGGRHVRPSALTTPHPSSYTPPVVFYFTPQYVDDMWPFHKTKDVLSANVSYFFYGNKWCICRDDLNGL